MRVNILTVFIGFLSAYMGVNVIVNPVSYDTKFMRVVDLGTVKWPFGITLILFSLMLFWSEYRRIKKSKRDNSSFDDTKRG